MTDLIDLRGRCIHLYRSPMEHCADCLRERVADLDAEIERLRAGGFLAEVATEVDRARTKFPSPAGSMVALMEEVGELARAMLDESDARVRAEAVQVAAMAMRVAEEGDPTLDDLRAVREGGK